MLSEFPETILVHLKEEYGTREQNKVFDSVLMGRKTYEVGLEQGITNPYPSLDQYVFSQSMKESPDKNVTLISRNVLDFVQSLKNKPGIAIWLCDGSVLATQLLAADLIDQFIIILNPVIFSSEIPLISGEINPATLKLNKSKDFKS